LIEQQVPDAIRQRRERTSVKIYQINEPAYPGR
jgi:hypothetical protein